MFGIVFYEIRKGIKAGKKVQNRLDAVYEKNENFSGMEGSGVVENI